MGELDMYGDHVIAFEAIRKSDVPSRMAAERRPLQPSNHQILQKVPTATKDVSALSDSKALFIPMSENPLVKRKLQDENATLVPRLNPRSPAQDRNPDSKSINRSNQQKMQSLPPGDYSSSCSASAPLVNAQTQGIVSGSQSVTHHSRSLLPGPIYEGPRVQPIISPIPITNAFEFYRETHRAANSVAAHRVHDRKSLCYFTLQLTLNSVGTLETWVMNSWACMDPSQRAAWEAGARGTGNSQLIPSVPGSEPSIQKAPQGDEAPIYSAETELPKQRFFQLQTLLKDAPPEMLEHGVEQGVKLLEDLRAPMLDKLEGSSDAAQWIQQIGKSSIHMQALRDLHRSKIHFGSKLKNPKP